MTSDPIESETTEPAPAKYSTELYDVDGSAVIFKKPDGYRLKLNFNRSDMVRIRYAPEGAEFLPDDTMTEAIAKQDSDYAHVPVTVDDTDTDIVISSSQIKVSVSKTDYSITIFDNDGKTLLKNAGKPFTVSGKGKKLSFQIDACGETEHFYGLGADPGLTFQTTDHRGTSYKLWLEDVNVHGITPLYFSTAGYGVYLHNSNCGTISFFDNDYSINIDDGEMDCYFIYGPSFKTVLSNFTELSGFMNMPPLYSLGLTFCCSNYHNAQTVINNIKTLHNAGISVDISGVVISWQTASYPCSYVWSDNFTKNPQQFIDTIHSMGVKLNFWEHPYVSPKAPIYDAIAPYSLLGSDVGARQWGDGTLAYGFGGLIPDLTIPEAKEIYWDIQDEKLFSLGIDGLKTDETDSWVCDAKLTTVFPSGLTANAYHNLLGTQTTNLVHAKLKEEYNKRTVIFSRGNFTGMQRYANVAYTDFYEFDQFLMAVIAQGYSGTYFSPEMRNVQTGNDIDYQRRLQMMYLTPFPISNEWIDGQLVTSRSRTVIDNYKKYNALHYSIIPYIYSCFWEQHNTGIGVIRPLPLEFDGDSGTYGINNQYMLGGSFLVCPVNSRAKVATTSIYLPAGCDWYDYNSGYVFEGGQTIKYSSESDTLPLFVRAGAIIPMKHYGTSTEKPIDNALELDVYPSDGKSSFTMFEDDGISYDYEKGVYGETVMSVEKSDGAVVFTSEERTGTFTVPERDCILRLHYRSMPDSVTLNGKALTKADSLTALDSMSEGWYYNGSVKDNEKIIYVKYTDNGKKTVIRAEVGAEDGQTPPPVLDEEYEIPETGVVYECEGEGTEFHGPGVIQTGAASGGAAVYGIMKEGYIVMNGINVPEDGMYRAKLTYLSGAKKLMCHVSVNGAEDFVVLLYSSGGWGVTSSVEFNIPLTAGENSIKFFGLMEEQGVPYLDCLRIFDGQAEKLITLTPVDLTEAVTEGGVKRTESVLSESGYIIGPFNSKDDKLRFNIARPENGEGASAPILIELVYSNPNENEVELTFSAGGSEYIFELPQTYSYEQFGKVSMTVYLMGGNNEVSVYTPNNLTEGVGIGSITISG